MTAPAAPAAIDSGAETLTVARNVSTRYLAIAVEAVKERRGSFELLACHATITISVFAGQHLFKRDSRPARWRLTVIGCR